jgi:hypothetical protein
MADELDGLRALTARLGPSQALRALRRSGGLETMESRSAGMHVDAAMMDRHEYLTRQRAADGEDLTDDHTGLHRRERELYLLQLQAE